MGALGKILGKAAKTTAVVAVGPLVGVGLGVSLAPAVPTPVIDQVKDLAPGLSSFDETWQGHTPAEVCQGLLNTPAGVHAAYLEEHQTQSNVLQCFSGNERSTVIVYHPRKGEAVDLSDIQGEVIEKSQLLVTDGDGQPVKAQP